MPRRSAAELAAPPAPQVPGQGRPEPPAELDGVEQVVWAEVVSALPPYAIDGAGALVLRTLVAQAAVARRLERRLRVLRETGHDKNEVAAAVAARHVVTAKAVTYLLTALRATPRSRDIARKAGPEIDKVPAFRPWETSAEDGDTAMQ
jgi:hypothetical protein